MPANVVIPPSLQATLTWLGLGGLVPFAAGVAARLWSGPHAAAWVEHALVAYGAVILSFLGAVHWGFALTRPGRGASRMLVIGVVPSLIGWASAFLPFERALAVQVAAFGTWWLYEHRVLGSDVLPEAYLQLRRTLTLVVVTLLAVGLIVPSASVR